MNFSQPYGDSEFASLTGRQHQRSRCFPLL